jgi:hypothetical protein
MLHRRYLYHITRAYFKKNFGLLKEISANWGPGPVFVEMPKEGVEPSPCCQDGILNPAHKRCNHLQNKSLTDSAGISHMYFTENTPASFKSYNNVISSHYQQYSGRIGKSSHKKRQRSLSKTSKSDFLLLFWHTTIVLLRSRTCISTVLHIILDSQLL